MSAAVPASMRAWVANAYGGLEVLTLDHVPVPRPGAKEVLIRVQATTVSSADRRIRAMDFPSGMRLAGRLAFGLTRPRPIWKGYVTSAQPRPSIDPPRT